MATAGNECVINRRGTINDGILVILIFLPGQHGNFIDVRWLEGGHMFSLKCVNSSNAIVSLFKDQIHINYDQNFESVLSRNVRKHTF